MCPYFNFQMQWWLTFLLLLLGRVHISNEGKEVITYVVSSTGFDNKNGSFGQGVIGKHTFVRKSLGLTKVRRDLVHCFLFSIFGLYERFLLNMQGSRFRMKYNGYSMRSLPNSVQGREKVYKLQIVEIGGIEEFEPEAPDWAAEAKKKPLVLAQLPHGVPTQWLTKITRRRMPLRLQAEQYRTFMDQIGEPYKRRVEAL
jgi:hypothetical protein